MVTRYESVHLPHFAGEAGVVPPGIAERRALYGDLARFASLAESGILRKTPIQCPKRPGRKPCRGLLVVRRSDVPPRVGWQCPECSAGGQISGWEESGDDLRREPFPPAEGRVVRVSARAHTALREIARTDDELIPLVYGAEVEGAAQPVLRVRDADGARYTTALFRHLVAVSSDRCRVLLAEILMALSEALGQGAAGSPPGLIQLDPAIGRDLARALLELDDAAPPEFIPAAPRRGPRSTRRRQPMTYRIKVTLRGVSPPVWRRLIVPSDLKLPMLHEVLQAAMGWYDCHLHLFQVGDRAFAPPGDFDPVGEDSRDISLHDIAPRKGSRVTYEYDFGDGWRHDIVVEDVIDGRCEAARCLKGRRNCPPEDCGGPMRYTEFRAAIADPSHEEHESWRELLPSDFDPEAFDLVQTDALVRRVRLRRGS